MPIRLPIVLSPTRAELGSRCHRRHFLSDVVDRRSYNSPAAAFGTVKHVGVGTWWQTRNAQLSYDKMEKSWRQLRPTGDKHSWAMAHKLLTNYMAKISLAGPLPGNWEIIQLEQRANVEIEGMILSFQIDRLLQNDKGDIALIDLKTAGRLDQRWRDQWPRNLQMKLYRRGLELLDFEWRNFYLIIEGVQKSASWKKEYVMCPEWSESILDEAEEQWLKVAREDDRLLLRAKLFTDTDEEMRAECERIGVTETSFNYGDCFSYYYACPYLDICTAAPEQRYAMLEKFDIKPTEGY